MKREFSLGKPYTEKEAAHLVDLLMQAPGIVAVFRGKDHICEFINDNLVQLMGGRNVIGMDIYTAFPGAESTLKYVKRVYETGKMQQDREYPIKIDWEQNGNLREYYYNYIFQPIRDEDDEVSGVMTYGFDVTEDILVRRRYELLLSSMSEAVVVTDSAFIITHWNRAAELLFGRGANDAIGKPFLEVARTEYHSPEFPEVSGEDALRMLREKDIWKGEARVRNSAGHWQDVIISQRAMKEERGDSVAGIVVVYYDVTEIKDFERRKDDFIAFASHEFKTPLMALSMQTEVLQYEIRADPQKALSSVEKIQKHTKELSRLVDSLLDFSKIEVGIFELEKKQFSLDKLVYDTVTLLQDTTKTHTIRIEGRIDSDIYADPGRVSQVLINFLTNAIKFSPQGGEIVVSVQTQQRGVKVSVKDQGIGIMPDVCGRLFEPFYRAEGMREKTFPGFGLGLAISKEIVDKHNGEIGVESVYGKGSTFFFMLPFETASV